MGPPVTTGLCAFKLNRTQSKAWIPAKFRESSRTSVLWAERNSKRRLYPGSEPPRRSSIQHAFTFVQPLY